MKVDQTVLPGAQMLLARLVQGRGEGYRHGGEEFLLILPNLDTDEALAFAEKVRRSFEQESFDLDGHRETVTVSIGVAVWPDSGETYDAVVEAAGRAMTEAKKNRNSVRLASRESS